MKVAPLLFATALLTLAACESKPPTIDATTEETFKLSIEEVKNALPSAEQDAFKNAAQVVLMSGFDVQAMFNGADPEAMGAEGMARLNGMTAEDVLMAATAIQEERAAQKRAADQKRIAELDADVAELEEKLEGLAGTPTLKVTYVSFEWRKSSYSTDPYINIGVMNTGPVAISRAFFDSKVFTPGRSVPWAQESFNFTIPGGIEPGETHETELRPNMFSGWGLIPKDRSDLQMEAIPYKAEGPNESVIFDAKLKASLAEDIAELRAQIETKKAQL